MSQQLISATYARDNFAEIANLVLYQNQEFVVEKNGKPAVFIGPVKQIQQTEVSQIMTTNDFLKNLVGYKLKTKYKNFARDHDKFIWE
jgi:hypothetical protein